MRMKLLQTLEEVLRFRINQKKLKEKQKLYQIFYFLQNPFITHVTLLTLPCEFKKKIDKKYWIFI